MAHLPKSRWSVVEKLQQRLHYSQPGSEAAEILEHAISLVVNSKSQELNQKFFLLRHYEKCKV